MLFKLLDDLCANEMAARVEVSRYLKKWSAKKEGFLRREGGPPKVRYYPLVLPEAE